MSEGGHRQNLLSSELWSKVFSLVAEDAAEAAANAVRFKQYEDIRFHACYHDLRRVCKTFDRIFKQDPALSSYLCLQEDMSLSSLPSLLKWLRHLSVEKLFAACDSCITEAALALLTASGNHLSSVVLSNMSNCGITLLSGFPFLSQCELTSTDGQVDLSPLQTLPKLTQLRLREAEICNLGHLGHLTYLSLETTHHTSDQDCLFVNCLQQLYIDDGTLVGFHTLGISACRSLQSLDCDSGQISAAESNEYDFDILDFTLRLPSALSALNQLTQLKLSINSHVQGDCDLHWLYALTKLQRLGLSFRTGAARIKVNNSMSSLSRLTDMSFALCHPESLLQVDLSWQLMQQLAHVALSSAHVHLTEQILSLAQVRHLKYIRLVANSLCDAKSAQMFGVLMYTMATECPQVCCVLGPGNKTASQRFADFSK